MSNWKLVIPLILFSYFANSQTPLGKWTTIDDTSGEPRSVVEIFERDGKIFGRIVKLFRKPGEDPDPLCTECDRTDARYKKKIIGLEIISGMVKSGNEYSHGNILDPESGKIYKCKLWVEGDMLQVRGYWGPFFRTQTWKKVP